MEIFLFGLRRFSFAQRPMDFLPGFMLCILFCVEQKNSLNRTQIYIHIRFSACWRLNK